MSGGVVYHIDRWVPAEQAVLPMSSIALRYGLSVFEGVRVYRQADGSMRAWLLDQHLARLRSSLAAIRLPEPAGDALAGLPQLVDEATRRNGLADDGYCRIAVSPITSGLLDAEVETVLTVSVTPMGRKRWLATGTGMRVRISDRQRASAAVFPPRAKNISQYPGSRLALIEAKEAGFDNCLLRSISGAVCEAPTANICIVTDGVLRTPPLADDVLPGVTRAWVLAAASEVGLQAKAESISAEDVRRADERFLCGTGIEFAAIESVDGIGAAAWPARPAFERLVELYFRQVRGQAPVTVTDWAGE